MPRKWSRDDPRTHRADETVTDERYAALLRGDPRKFLHPGQIQMHEAFLSMPPDAKIFVTTAGRGVGKTRWGSLLAQAFIHLASPGFVPDVKYVFPTLKLAKKVLIPVLNRDFQSYPASRRPTWNRDTHSYHFPNGGVIWVLGADQDIGGLGQDNDLVIMEEAGFYDEPNDGQALDVLVNKMALPRLRRGGRILMLSTPAATWDHLFNNVYVPAAQMSGCYFRIDSYQNPHRSQAELDAAIAEVRKRPHGDIIVRREFYGEVIADPSALAIPEFAMETHMREFVRPPYFKECKKYVFVDLAYAPDLTGIVYGYAHFDEGAFIVEDESLITQAKTRDVAEEVRRKLDSLGYEENNLLFLYADVSDQRFIPDIASEHHLYFAKPLGVSNRAKVNALRNAFTRGQVFVHPRCQRTVIQLRNVRWKSTSLGSETFVRTDAFGHFDLVAALQEAPRLIDLRYNPSTGSRVDYAEWAQKHLEHPEHLRPRTMQTLGRAFGSPRRIRLTRGKPLGRI